MEGTGEDNTVSTTGLRRLFQLLRLAVLPAAILVAAWMAWSTGYFDLEHRRRLVGFVSEFHSMPFAYPAFVLFWAFVVSLALPAAIASTVGGAIFGPVLGGLANWLGALAATACAHWLARGTVRASLIRVFGEHRLLRMLRERADTLMLLRLRLMPLAPFATLDYVAGIAGVQLRRLLVATAIGVIPSAVAYSYLGAQIMVSARASSGALPKRALWIAAAATAVMLLLSVVPTFLHRRRD